MLEKTKMAVCSAMLLVSLLFVASPIAMGLVETKSGQQQIQNSDDHDGGIITGKNTKGYERYIFTLKFDNSNSGSVGKDSFSWGQQYDTIRLSCCIKSKDKDKEKFCDFSVDDSDCVRYIDRETGEPYKSKTYYMDSIFR